MSKSVCTAEVQETLDRVVEAIKRWRRCHKEAHAEWEERLDAVEERVRRLEHRLQREGVIKREGS